MVQPAQNDSIIVCTESFPENYELTQNEISSYASQIGVNLDAEKHLLPIIVHALSQPLPKDWVPCFDKTQGNYFYFNTKTGTSQWEHPADQYYRVLIEKLRTETTALVENSDTEEIEDIFNSSSKSASQEMLPLRQNRKPQLMPIKELLKIKEDERQLSDEEKKFNDFESHSPLKLKGSNLKKLVTFDTDRHSVFPERRASLFNKEYERNLTNSDKLDLDTPDLFKRNKELLSNIYSHYQHSLNDDEQNEYFKDKAAAKKLDPDSLRGTLKTSNAQNRPKSALRSRNSSRRLQINLQPPERLLLSDNNDDTTRNMFSDSVSSELVSDEEETPHNILTNITESGIDVNTVTDLQKLKAKGILNNQNNGSDLDKKIINTVNNSLGKVIGKIEQNLITRFESKMDSEVTKLRKHYKDKASASFSASITPQEKQFIVQDVVNASQEKLEPFQKRFEEKLNSLNDFQDKYNLEMKKLEEKLTQRLSDEFEKINSNGNNVNDLRSSIHEYTEERLKSIEQNLDKKLENLETKHKTEVDKFKLEKEKLLSEQHKKFHLFLDEYDKSKERIREENLKSAVQNEINNLLSIDENKFSDDNNLLIANIKKLVLGIMESNKVIRETPVGNMSDNCRSVGIQTEETANKEELDDIKDKIEDILKIIKHSPDDEVQDKDKKSSTSELNARADVSKRYHQALTMDIPNLSSIYVENSVPGDFDLRSSSSNIDKELDHYRKKYLHNSKWIMQMKYETKANPKFKVFQ